MGNLVNFVTPLHQATSREYLNRMMDDIVHCMLKAKNYDVDYWDCGGCADDDSTTIHHSVGHRYNIKCDCCGAGWGGLK